MPREATHPHADDRQALLRVARGDREAIAELYDRHATLVYSVALRVTRDDALAQDVVQDVFVTAWRKAALYDHERAGVATWLATIARNRAVDRLRAEHRDRQQPGELPELESDDVPLDAALLDGERSTAVRQSLAAMPPRQREVLELMYFRGLSQSEVAERLGVPLGTVKSRAFHGLQRLRELLEEHGVVGAS